MSFIKENSADSAPTNNTVTGDGNNGADPSRSPDAFEREWKKHQTKFSQFAVRLTHNYDIAQDVIQDAHIRGYRAYGTYKGESAFTTWMYRILANSFFDIKKKSKRHEHGSLENLISGLEDGNSFVEYIPSKELSPHEQAEQNLDSDAVLKELDELRDDYKVVLTLFAVEGMTYEEVAEILDIPVGTVKSRLNRARERMRSNEKLASVYEEIELEDEGENIAHPKPKRILGDLPSYGVALPSQKKFDIRGVSPAKTNGHEAPRHIDTQISANGKNAHIERIRG